MFADYTTHTWYYRQHFWASTLKIIDPNYVLRWSCFYDCCIMSSTMQNASHAHAKDLSEYSNTPSDASHINKTVSTFETQRPSIFDNCRSFALHAESIRIASTFRMKSQPFFRFLALTFGTCHWYPYRQNLQTPPIWRGKAAAVVLPSFTSRPSPDFRQQMTWCSLLAHSSSDMHQQSWENHIILTTLLLLFSE